MTNNYEGKTAGQVWGEWSPKQKSHFIKDHYPEKVGDERFAIIKAKFEDIPANIQKGLEAHISEESYADGGEVGQRYYNTMKNVGKSKYVINYHDGKKKHNDGSLFYDIEIFSNKKDFEKREKQLIKEGYKYQYENGGIINQYEGKTPEEVWEAWTVEQRLHFLNDHNDQLSVAHRIKKAEIEAISRKPYSELGILFTGGGGGGWLDRHIKEGEYERGGDIRKEFKKGEFVKNVVFGGTGEVIELINPSAGYTNESYKIKKKDGEIVNWWATDIEPCYECGGKMESGGSLSEQYDTAISEAEPIIGFTSSGKPVYESLPATDERYTYNNFDSKDHAEASMIHMESELSTLPMDKRDELSADHYRQTDEYKQGQLNAQMEEDELNARLQKEAEEDEFLEQQHIANGVKVYIPSLQKEGVASFKVGEGVYVKFPDASDGYFKESDLVKLDDKEWLSEAKEEEFTNDNIDVFGYETKNFDISEKALDQFKSAIEKIEAIRENETQFAKKSKALKDAAEKLDVVLGIHKKVIEEKEPLTNDELRSLMHELVYFTVNDYKADVLIDFSIIIDSVIEIVTTKEKPSGGTIAKVLMVSAINPLSTQLRKETGEGYSSDAFDEEQLDGFSVLRHKASGKTFAVFQKEYYSKAGAPKIREDLDFILSNDIFGITGFDRQYEGGGEINLHSGHLGNGLTYWDSNNEVHGDYKTVAHISPSGVISYYYKHLPDHLRKQIEGDAERIKNGELKYEFGGKMKDGDETNDNKKHCSIITFEDLHVKVIPGKHSYKDVLNSHKELPKNIEHIEFTESNSVKAFEEFSKNLVEEKFGSTFIEGNPITESEREPDGEGVLIIKSIGILEDGKNVHYCPEELTWKEDGHDNDDEPGDDEEEFAKGGELADWQERLKGKTVDLYQNGDKNNSSEREIIDISVAPSHFKNRDVILTFSDRLESKFPLSKLEKFSEGYKVEIKGVKEPYVIQLVPSDVELPFKKGGTIPNNYEGKTPEEVWDNEWTVDQKKHFYLDNYMGNNRLTPKDISNAMLIGGGNKKGFATKFIDLTDNLQKAITEHVKYGQYKTGGEILGGQSFSQLKPSGYKLISAKGREIIVSNDDGKTKERYIKNDGFAGYHLVYKGHDYEFVDSFKTGGELLKSAKAGLHKLEIGAKKVATKVAVKSKVVGKKVAAKSKKIAHSAAVTFAEKSAAIAKKLEGSDVSKKYQKVYGKKFDKKEAKVAGNKIAGTMVHKGKKK